MNIEIRATGLSAVCVAALVVLASAVASHAEDPILVGITYARDAGTDGSTCSGGGSAEGDCVFHEEITSLPPAQSKTEFSSRYAWNINADALAGGEHDTSGTAVHRLSFNAIAPGGYSLTVATKRQGRLDRVSDDPLCSGEVTASGVTGMSSAPISLGTLDLPSPGTIPDGTTDVGVVVSQQATATIFGVSDGVERPHTLTFTWSGSVRSDSCEVSIRQGSSGGTTTDCSVCGVLPAGDKFYGHFVEVQFKSLCGNGTIDSAVGEQCDPPSSGCCTSNCQIRSAGVVCRASAGVCDVPEVCDGVSSACPANVYQPTTTVCRGSGGLCDVAETCNGIGPTCPVDQVWSNIIVCRPAADVCDHAELCNGVSKACPANGFEPASVECRPWAGECDVAENCSGIGASCPADAKITGSCSPDTNPCTADVCDGTSAVCQHPAGNAGTICRAAAGACDVAESCDGTSTACPVDALAAAATVCRASTNECDVAETCDGVTVTCAADAKQPAGTACGSDGNACTVDACDGASDACGHTPGNAGATCRAAAGLCDVVETCDGTTAACPFDGFAPYTQECRSVGGPCDLAENCTGSSAACPADQVQPTTQLCRAAAGECDVAENCSGAAPSCPADAKRTGSCTTDGNPCTSDVCDGVGSACAHPAGNAGTVCRVSAGVCDVAEACDGSNAACPADALVPSTQVCRMAMGSCDVAENCTGASASCPVDQLAPTSTECRPAADVCDQAEHCTGNSTSCPVDGFQPALQECRAAAGECDIVETCSGVSSSCPADAKRSDACTSDGNPCTTDTCDGLHGACQHPAGNAGTTCRAAAGPCDAVEACDGSSAACPADAKQPGGTTCRAAAGICDVAESCDGTTAACPADAKEPGGKPCRAAAGICDVAESCDGTTAVCPTDAFAPPAQLCRAAAGACDVAEHCSGINAPCPLDAFQPDATPCDDGLSCSTGDACQSGVCAGISGVCGDGVVDAGCAEQCDDGNDVGGDGCSSACLVEPGLACGATPATGCRPPFRSGKARLTIRDATSDNGDQLAWKWPNGSLTSVIDFGDPRGVTSYQLCIFDQSGRVLSVNIPAGGVCAGRFCWTAIGTNGFKYKDSDLTPDGISQVTLKQGVDGKARIQLKGRGGHLGLPNLADLVQPIEVQLTNTAGVCWGAVYSAPALSRSSDRFDDKAD